MQITSFSPITLSAPPTWHSANDAAEAPLQEDAFLASCNVDANWETNAPQDLQGAIQNLQHAKDKPYYDEAGDKKSIEGYYADVKPEEGGKPFFRALHKLVQDTHETELAYEPSLYLYPWVDLRPDLSLKSIYSSKSISATEAIVSDYNQAKYWNSLGQMAATAALSPERAGAQIAITASNHMLNCEHVVCQSWFDHTQPMKGDLHHLFSCDPQTNSYRGNHPLAIVDQPDSTMPEGGSLGGGGFEPEAGKGAAARATLYFLVRYPKKISEYRPEDLQTLLKWNKEDPPSLYERHRNQAIQTLQGNRNPFIDHPEWADKVDFTLGILLHPKDEAPAPL